MEFCSSCKRFLPPGMAACPEDGAEVKSAQEPPEGVLLGAYRIKKKLGQGAMGAVFLAEHSVLQKRCALKLLRPQFTSQPEVSARFLQEARATNAVEHDHVVTIYDFGQSPDGGAYLVMEYLEGETLTQYLKKHAPLSLKELLLIFTQLASALFAAHEKGVIHRDLKPDNIFILQREGAPFAKVLDFGVAKILGDLAIPGLTRAGTVVGTPQYMAPEQMTGKPSHALSDIYALGVILYEAAAGRVPFPGPRLSDFAQQHLFEAPPPLPEASPAASGGLEPLVLRMLAKKPEERPASMKEVEDALRALDTGGGGLLHALPNTTRLAPPPAPSLNPKRTLVGVSLGVLFLSLAGAYFAFAGGESKPTGTQSTPASLDEALNEAQSGSFRALSQLACQEAALSLASPEDAIRRGAIEALAKTRSYSDLTPFLTALDDPNPEVRRLAAKALGASGRDEAIGPLREAFESARGLKFEFALARLAAGDETARAYLASELDNRVHRWEAALALAWVKDPRALPVLEEGLEAKEVNPSRAIEAAEVLARQGDEVARESLRTLFALGGPHRLDAARALAALGEEESRALLQKLARDPSQKEGLKAALALAELGDRAARDALLKIISGEAPPEEKREAALALARLGEAQALSPLGLLLKDPDPLTRITAAHSICALSTAPKEATP